MDPITAALVAALASGINSVTNIAIKDAYTALKNKLFTTLSGQSDALDALKNLEKKPESKGHQAVLDEELVNFNLTQDEEIKLLLTNLLDQLRQTESGKEALSKYTVTAKKIGVVGDNAHIKDQSF